MASLGTITKNSHHANAKIRTFIMFFVRMTLCVFLPRNLYDWSSPSRKFLISEQILTVLSQPRPFV